MAAVLLVPAFFAAAAVLPLLFVAWFEPTSVFSVLHADTSGTVLEPSAWQASGVTAAVLALLALLTLGAVVEAWRGRFVAWTVGAACGGAGALLALILRVSPPDPPRSTYVTGDQAYDPTAVPLLTMGCFALAGLALTAWALAARRATA